MSGLRTEQLEIVYEDKYILVCVKPARVISQSNKSMDYDMVSRVKNYRVSKNEDSYVAIINRLDRPVRGITLFAKDKKTAAILTEKMKTHDFGKYYKAKVRLDNVYREDDDSLVLLGKQYSKDELIGYEIKLTDYLVKDGKSNTSKIADKNVRDAKKGELIFKITHIDEQEKVADVNVKLLTGRHHQIRAQMAHAGLPLAGDTKYGEKAQAGKFVDIMLCAYKLEIEHPITHKSMKFEIE